MDQQQPQFVKARRTSKPSVPQPAAVRNLASLFGLDARAALLTIVVDLLVFSSDTLSMEMLLPLGAVLAAALGLIVYQIQRHHGKDSHREALIKSLIVSLLTAIPIPITPLFSLPAMVFGLLARRGHSPAD